MLRNIIKQTASRTVLCSRRTRIPSSSLFATRTYATDAPTVTPRSELKEGIQLIITQRSSIASVSARSIDEIHKAMADIAGRYWPNEEVKVSVKVRKEAEMQVIEVNCRKD
jgi:septum formation topological specificity factor MinE